MKGHKYSFMRNAGTNVTAYVSTCWHNCSFIQGSWELEHDDTPIPAPRHGRPKRVALLERKPSLKPNAAASSCTRL